MKIALVSVVKPQKGSADGITEYAYNLYEKLRSGNDIELIYSLEKMKRVNVLGMLSTQLKLRLKGISMARAGFDVVHITNHELGFVAGILRLFGTRAKIIFTVHDLMRFGRTNFNKGIAQRFYDHLVTHSMRIGYRSSDFVIYSAKSVEDLAAERIVSTLPSAVTLLAVKDEFISKPVKAWKKKDKMAVGYVGSLAHSKNVSFILETAEKMKKHSNRFKFIIYGAGPEYGALTDYARLKKLDNVSFMGFAPEDKLINIYDSFDVCMFPTPGEGFGLPILDAQARGVPVIALKNSKVDEEVKKYCFKAQTPTEASRILLDLNTNGFDKSRREAMIKHARSFTWQRTASQTMRVYESLLKKKK